MLHWLKRSRAGASVDVVFWVDSLVLQGMGKDLVLLPAASRRRMSCSGRSHSHLRSASTVSVDALGARAVASAITSISGVLFLALRCFPWDICLTRLQGQWPKPAPVSC